MNIFQWLGDLVLSQWIWSMTFDFVHYTFSFCIMFIILLIFTKKSFLHSLFMTLFSVLFSFAALFFIGTVILDTICNWDYCPISATPLTLSKRDVMVANFILGLFVTLFQGLFFTILSLVFQQKILAYFYTALLSNFLAAFCAYGYIMVNMRHLF